MDDKRDAPRTPYIKPQLTPNHRNQLRSIALEEAALKHQWSNKTYTAIPSPGFVERSSSSQSEPKPHMKSPALLPALLPEARVPEFAYTQVFQASPTSKARVEVLHHEGKVQIKSSDLELSAFQIEQKGRGWLLSFEINGTPNLSPNTSPNSKTRNPQHEPRATQAQRERGQAQSIEDLREYRLSRSSRTDSPDLSGPITRSNSAEIVNAPSSSSALLYSELHLNSLPSNRRQLSREWP
jgi:hypothetical protein